MNYPMIPLRGLSIFPHMVLHFDIGREKSINALEQAMIRDQYVFLASQKDENTDLPTADDFYHVGTVAKVKQMLKLPGDTIRVLVEGVARGKIIEMIQDDPYFECEVDEDIEQDTAEEDQEREEALIRMTLAAFEEYAALSEKTPKEVFHSVAGIQRGGALADAIAGHMKLSVEDNQKVLEALEPCERLETVYTLLVREIEIMGIELDINRKVKEQMSQNQREYYLKEQMRAIQGELGFDDDLDDEIIKWHEQMDELELPADICEKLEKEINRLNRMQPTSAEAGVIRTYIETILALPWNKLSEEHIDLKEAEKILDEDHYGLEKVKERVLEYLAVVELSHEIKGPIICLVGPPGTGKTSIAKSIARATGREFVRMSLGGVRDEAEIRGHRRTYIGAIPGRVINSIKDAGTRNPLFLFDEVDKLGSDFKGDPSSALLEVLDPEQNKDFTDHYLEVPFDKAVAHNEMYTKSVSEKKVREKFFKDLSRLPFNKMIRKYGRSKEHRPNPIVQMGLFMDGDGIPLAFSIFPGNESEQPTLIPLEKTLLSDFAMSKFIVCTDAGLSSYVNRKFNDRADRDYVVTQSLQTFKSHIK